MGAMDLNLPEVGVTPSQEWAEQLNTQIETKVQEHDHTEGKGNRIPAAALSIDADLPINGNNLTQARSVRFTEETAVNEITDVGCIYRLGEDLWYTDGAGTPIQITDDGALAASSLGGINGLPSGTASAGFSTDTFSWKKSSTAFANMKSGPVEILSGNDTNPVNGVTLVAQDGMLAPYDITLPAAPPAQESFVTMGSNGNLIANISRAGGITSTMLAPNSVTESKIENGNVTLNKLGSNSVNSDKILNLAVTRAKMEAVGQAQSSSASSLTGGTAATDTDITNFNVSLTINTLRPVIVMAHPAKTAFEGFFRLSSNSHASAFFQLVYSGSESGTFALGGFDVWSTDGSQQYTGWPASALNSIIIPTTTGTLNIKVQYRILFTGSLNANGMFLTAYQL